MISHRRYRLKQIVVFCLISCSALGGWRQEDPPPSGYQHDKFGTKPREIFREYRAFDVSFDSRDDDNGDGVADVLAVPQWVSYEIRAYPNSKIKTHKRPKWFTDNALATDKLAPTDASYSYSKAFLTSHPNWFERGHLCMKFIGARLGAAAENNTHILLNAVPQRGAFNKTIWQNLEYYTGAWAQRYGKVWIITGPILQKGKPYKFIGEPKKRELPVTIPDFLFKIVVKERPGGSYDILAFIYPQENRAYIPGASFNHSPFFCSIDEIEKRTGLDFFTKLSPAEQTKLESVVHNRLWPATASDFLKAQGGGE